MLYHTREEIESFFSGIGQASSTWARFRPVPGVEGEPRHMASGTGELYRADTREGRYRCVLPSCDGLLVVAAGTQIVHHWRHRAAPTVAHSPETLWHLTAKTALAQWASSQQPDAEIIIDTTFTPSRNNKPDVWVRWAGGNVAFEVQFSALDPSSLSSRSERYDRDQIEPVWLFAHLEAPKIARLEPGSEERSSVRLRGFHRQASRLAPLRWFNPDLRLVATAYVQKSERPDVHRGEAWLMRDVAHIVYTRHAGPEDSEVSVALDALDDCTLDKDGLHAPTDRWIEQRLAEAEREEQTALAAYSVWRAERTAQAQLREVGAFREPVEHQPRGDPGWGREPYRVSEPRPPRDPLNDPCPYCLGQAILVQEWPDWYRPPTGTTHVVVCSICELILGSRQASPE